MYQKNVQFIGYKELSSNIASLKEELSRISYTDGYMDISIARMDTDEVSDCLHILKKEFPLLKILGVSCLLDLDFYNSDGAFAYDKIITINFVLMVRAKVKIFSLNFNDVKGVFGNELNEFAVETREQIKRISNVKCIEMYCSRRKLSVDSFLRTFTDGIEDIPVYGAVAGPNFYEDTEYINYEDADTSRVIADDKCFAGIVIAACYGENLYAYVDYIFGWEPVGRQLKIDKCSILDDGTYVVDSLDDDAPANIYKKYLGIKENDYFVYNISEFPFVLERDGLYMGRTPSAFGDKGEFYLEGDILQGESVRLSYGDHDFILEGSKNSAMRMKQFDAQVLSLVICSNRFRFFQSDYRMEMNFYEEALKRQPSLILGMGEIYRYKGKGGVMNSALVAAGMREWNTNKNSKNLDPDTISYQRDGIIPLSERLSHFLKAMTGELEEAVLDAQAANEAKSTFLSNMSHEIRTPINAVLGMDEMILRESEDEQILEYAQNIKTAGSTLLGLINDILDFSKIEAGKMDIVPVDYDLASVINDLVTMIKPRGESKGLELIFDIDSSIPGELHGDEIRIKQVITNILTNAVKYTEKGSVTLKIYFEEVSDNEINLKVAVKDTGIGIKEEDLKLMYNAFQRVDEVRNRNVEGTGLGLNITRQLLNLMGSELNVSSVYGEGSEFSFSIKQKVIKKDPIGNYMEAYHKALENRARYQEKFIAPDAEVLVVDDTPMNLTVFRNLLKKTKMKIDTAESGMECLEKTGQKKYDIIFLDHRMPVMDGIETLVNLKEDRSNPNTNTISISLTANAVSGAREQYIDAGFDDYLTKPIIPEKLEEMLIRYLPDDKVIRKEGEDLEDDIDLSELPEWIRGIAELHLEEGVENCGSVEGYIDTVKSFADAAEESYNDIERFFSSEDIKNYTIKVHALKSSARIIGAKELSALAEALEKAGDNRDISRIKKDTPKLLDMFKVMSEKFAKVSEDEEEDENLPQMDQDQFKEAENAMKEVAGSFDYDSISYIMETINNYRVPIAERKRIRELRKAITGADWEKIRKILGIHN